MPSYIRTRTEFAVNSFTADNQTAPSVSTFADGGFIVVWGTMDGSQDGSGSAIKAQRFDSAGSKVGSEFLVNSSASGHQFTPSVATLANGNFVVTWATTGAETFPMGSGHNGISARLYNSLGSALGAEFQVDTSNSTSLFEPVVTALANGGFVISWSDWNGVDVKARLYDSAGSALGAEFRLNTNVNGTQDGADLTALANGGFVAAWRTTDSGADGSGEAVKAQIFDSSGARVGAEFLVNGQTSNGQLEPSITALAGGGFVITWMSRDPAQDGSNGAVKGQIFTASGTKLGGEFLVNTQAADMQRDAVVTGTPDGGFVVAWTNYSSSQDGSGLSIKAQAFDSAGIKTGAEMLVNTLAGGSQFLPDIATLADGRVIVTWASESGDIGGYAVRAQILGTEPAAPVPNAQPIIIWPYGSTGNLIVDEGVTAVVTVVASDDGEPNALRYSIAGGPDAGLFTINALTGALAFIEAPEHVEGGTNSYSVNVAASDGELSGWKQVYVSVRHVNLVTIVSDGAQDWAEVSIDEAQTAVTVVSAIDEDGLPLTYAITGGDDAGFFTIDAQSGALSFAVAPDYEFPEDYWGDNVYFVQVTATDGTRSDSQDIAVYVFDVEEPEGFAIASDGAGDHAELSVAENETAVTIVATSGAAGPVTYGIVGGADAASFTIDPETGELHFVEARDFEAVPPGYPNIFDVIVGATDGQSFDEQHLSIVLEDVDEAPIFYSYWGEAEVALAMPENAWEVGWVGAGDPDHFSWVTYGLEGADADLFEVDAYSGALNFLYDLRPDYESPTDADGDNVYQVTVVAYSGWLSASQSFSITIEDVVDGVHITSDGGGDEGALWVAENDGAVTVVAADGGEMMTYSIAGGADSSAFVIDAASGALSFASAPDFESAADADHDNVYEVIVRASDGAYADEQLLSVNVGDVDEVPEFFDYQGDGTHPLSMSENSAFVADLLAYDPDAGSEPIHYLIVGGADRDLFRIDSQTGRLTLLNPSGLDFENPADFGRDNVYDVEVMAGSGGLGRIQAFAITVTNSNEPLTILSPAAISMDEGGTYVTLVVGHDQDGSFPTYSIVGGADSARFSFDAGTGVLRFVDAPDFEAPTDAGGDNVYTVEVAATDGQFTSSQTMQITVRNVAERVTITSYGGAENVILDLPENGTAAALLLAVDPDGGPVSYSLAGEDSARFAIDPAGALRFIGSPDFEAPTDVDGNNSYLVTVIASDGTSTDTQFFRIRIGNVDEAVVIISNGGAAGAAVSVAENGLGVTIVAAADPDGGSLTYSIAGGADAARFTIDAATGLLTFISAPDFEAPADGGANNVYDVVVAASDGSSIDTQALAVSVGNVNEALAIGSNGGGATAAVLVAENGLAVTIVSASDLDGTAATYSIVGGADAARFTINAQTGVLQFVAAPDYELPADSNFDNVYAVVVRASDGQYSDDQVLNVSVGNVRDGNNVTGTSGGDSISATSTNVALRTSDEEDIVFGRDGHDTIQGMAGDDDLYGEAGNDVLTGGAGADRLTGGLGKDNFTYNLVSDSTAALRDQILDFSRSQNDKISLSAIDANSNAGNNQAFAFIGTAAFSNVAGQLRYETSGGVTIISGDVNGDGVADLQILVSGSLALVASDFVL
ncbi:MAG TPA: hypothetical protein VFP12_08155 [Allosphingosinicella sp.]|nr:hypothetical protein [Allosphingosinicella sp.]